MTPTSPNTGSERLPTHLDLPERDGRIVENFAEHPQGNLLTSCLLPRLKEIHPDEWFAVGHDSGIYWKITQPPLAGCKSPDWFYVPGVPPMLDGQYRRSYVLWQEKVRPLIVMEFVSGDGSEEHDDTPETGKFWVYERGIQAERYVIWDSRTSSLEVFRLEKGGYVAERPNEAGRYPFPPLRVEFGVWDGKYRTFDMPWIRVWDLATGEMLPTEEDRAARAEDRADTAESLVEDLQEELRDECERAESERRRAADAQRQRDDAQRQRDDAQRQRDEAAQRAAKLAEKLRALGIDPDAA